MVTHDLLLVEMQRAKVEGSGARHQTREKQGIHDCGLGEHKVYMGKARKKMGISEKLK